jgi:hypothetical protein
MRFPRFWSRAGSGRTIVWGWSDASEVDAQTEAQARLTKVKAWLGGGHSSYGYPDRPLREPVLREFAAGDRRPRAIVSRNSYGCEVLNTAELMFVDVDVGESTPAGPSLLAKLFGGSKPPSISPEERRVRSAIETWLQSNPGWGWRLYRTRAGFRLAATHAPIPPDHPLANAAFEAFGADPLYRSLCKTQACFRARLTPKPWRCDSIRPPVRWPFVDAQAGAAFQQWETTYRRSAEKFATCGLLGQFGSPQIHSALRDLVEFHDTVSRATARLPLA